MLLYKSFKTQCVLNFINILGYGAEPTDYNSQAIYNGQEDSLPDLTPFLIISIVILGLSLLFPTDVFIPDSGSRKRRYADEGNKKSINCAYFVHKLSSDAIYVQFV